MGIYVSSGWDFLLLLWGMAWVIATTLFLLGINKIFQWEEHQTEESVADHEAPSHVSPGHPISPAA